MTYANPQTLATYVYALRAARVIDTPTARMYARLAKRAPVRLLELLAKYEP